MKAKPDGLFWDNEDARFTKRKQVLEDHGWSQYKAGWWVETHLLKTVDNPAQIAVPIEVAYKLASTEKNEPPEPVWLKPDYLPTLKESLAFDVDLFTDEQLVDASVDFLRHDRQHELSFDIEVYTNYFLVAFKSITLGKVVYFEYCNSNLSTFDIKKLNWLLSNFCLVGFNSNNYDAVMLALAVKGYPTSEIKKASDMLIVEDMQSYDVLKKYRLKKLNINHIDLIEPAPLSASLKVYGGRLHVKKMQDLPFHPSTVLNDNQIHITRFYCINDLDLTIELYKAVKKELALRETMSSEYGLDLRSKSDAQIAEKVIASELKRLTGLLPKKPSIAAGTVYRYKIPQFMNFKTELMQNVLAQIASTDLVVGHNGSIMGAERIEQLDVSIGSCVYRMGIGGLHSSEKAVSHSSDNHSFLVDRDVVSYYPRIILNLGLYPEQLGRDFLDVYESIVNRRLDAKAAKNKTVADSLKITINGSFGKLGNKYSILYSPDLLIQVTLTGQLSLLMLIEELELAGIPVVSANTDGVVIKCPYELEDTLDAIIKQWEFITQFETEATYYSALHSRDVNNYLAIVRDPDEKGEIEIKTKGIFAESGLKKSPQNQICIDAVKQFLTMSVPIEKTITECKDVTKFVNVRTVKGGGVKIYEKGSDGLYLGKAIRWYYATNQVGKIVYASSGNTVPRSVGARPIMELPNALPDDVDYQWYINEAYTLLTDIGYGNK